MNLIEKNKSYIIGVLLIGVLLFLLLLIGEIILPFVCAIFFAYLLNPIILKIQKKIKVHSIETFAKENEQQIKSIKNNALDFIGNISDDKSANLELEDLNTEENKESLMAAIESVYSFFVDSEENKNDTKSGKWSLFYMITYTMFYTIMVLYSYNYFEEKYGKHFNHRKPLNKKVAQILVDFKITFVNYFRQRAKIVCINIIILIIAFTVMDLPGAIIIGIITGVLSYASHYHYLSLPLVGIGCWILSIENNTSFLLYFGIVLFLFILISILEETVYFEKIMKSVNRMNSAIVLLSFTLWIYVFGEVIGTIIALPLTQLIMILVDQFLLKSTRNQ